MTGVVPALAAAVLLVLAAHPLAAQAADPDAPVPPDAKFTIVALTRRIDELTFRTEDLKFRAEGLGGAVQALEVKATGTEIRIEMPADVLFDFDQAAIRPDATRVLAQAADVLRKYPTQAVVIEGHTDSRGTEPYNQRLSERRAQAVKTWFQEHEGLKNSTLTTRGLGSTRPVARNQKPDGSDDPDGRQRNRRVEIVIKTSSR